MFSSFVSDQKTGFQQKNVFFWIPSSSGKLSSSKLEGMKFMHTSFEMYKFFCHTPSETLFSSFVSDQKTSFEQEKI